MRISQVMVEWACLTVDGTERAVHISETPEKLEERRRHDYRCYGCEAPLSAHKRNFKAHSFVHPPAPNCPLASTDGEKAFHLHALLCLKHALDRAVASSAELSISTGCPQCRTLRLKPIRRVESPLLQLHQGDRVVLRKYSVGTREPDIQVLRGDKVLLVLDVFVHQQCKDEHWESRDHFIAPAVEVSAHHILPSGMFLAGGAWTHEHPLQASRTRRLPTRGCEPAHEVPVPSSRPPALSLPGGILEYRVSCDVNTGPMTATYHLVLVDRLGGVAAELRKESPYNSLARAYSGQVITRWAPEPSPIQERIEAAATAAVAHQVRRLRIEREGRHFTIMASRPGGTPYQLELP